MTSSCRDPLHLTPRSLKDCSCGQDGVGSSWLGIGRFLLHSQKHEQFMYSGTQSLSTFGKSIWASAEEEFTFSISNIGSHIGRPPTFLFSITINKRAPPCSLSTFYFFFSYCSMPGFPFAVMLVLFLNNHSKFYSWRGIFRWERKMLSFNWW